MSLPGVSPLRMHIDTEPTTRRVCAPSGAPPPKSIVRMLFRRLVRREGGQNLVECLLLVAFVPVLALAGTGSLGISTNGWFAALATFVGVDDAETPGAGTGGGGSSSKSNCSAMGAIKSGGKCQ